MNAPHKDLTDDNAPDIASSEQIVLSMVDMHADGKRVVDFRTYKDAISWLHLQKPKLLRAYLIEDGTKKLKTIGQGVFHKMLQFALSEIELVPRVSRKDGRRWIVESFHARCERFKRQKGLVVLEIEDAEEHNGLVSERLARTAAGVFAESVKMVGGRPLIGMGGGRALRRMANYLNRDHIPAFEAFPLNYVTRRQQDKGFDSFTIASNALFQTHQDWPHAQPLPPLPIHNTVDALFWHSRLCDADPEIMRCFNYPIHERLADMVFVGLGYFHEQSTAISHVMKKAGFTYDHLRTHDRMPIGDTNFNYLDNHGSDITPSLLQAHVDRLRMNGNDVPDLGDRDTLFVKQEFSHPFLLAYNLRFYRHLVKQGRKVVVVAGGAVEKARTLYALIKTKAINGLVTDDVTMDELLRLSENEVIQNEAAVAVQTLRVVRPSA